VFKAFIFATQAFVVFDRPKDFGAEETIAFGFKGAIVNRLWLFNFPKRPGPDHIWGGKSNADSVEIFDSALLFEEIQ
jgi:hypothetical protein